METLIFTENNNSYTKSVMSNYYTNPNAVISTDKENLTNEQLHTICGVEPSKVVVYEAIRRSNNSKTKRFDYYIYNKAI